MLFLLSMPSFFVMTVMSIVALVSVYYDIRERRVPNQLIAGGLIFMSVGVWWFEGWRVLGMGLGAAVLALFVWWPAWSLRMLGGGDHKLIAFVSAGCGFSLFIPLMLAIVFAGGAQAFITVCVQWLRRASRTFSFIHTVRTTSIPYAVAIAVGAVVAIAGRAYGWW